MPLKSYLHFKWISLLSKVVYPCKPSTWEVKARACDYFLPIEFKVSLGYRRYLLKKKISIYILIFDGIQFFPKQGKSFKHFFSRDYSSEKLPFLLVSL